MALVALFLVARPLIGDKARQATPAIIAVLFIPLLAVGIYTKLGTPGAATGDSGNARNSMSSPAAAAAKPTRELGSVASMLDGLAERLVREPDDAKGWLLLARSYQHLGRVEEARQAYDKAATLGKTDADLETKLSAVPAQAVSAATIHGRISLAPDAQERVLPGDIVFVFAKGVGGPPMPVAVVQKPAADLPFEFMLSDDHAMMQGASLSDYEKVVISARVSRTGSATESVKGLQIRSVPTVVNKSTFIELLIDSAGVADENAVAGE